MTSDPDDPGVRGVVLFGEAKWTLFRQGEHSRGSPGCIHPEPDEPAADPSPCDCEPGNTALESEREFRRRQGDY